MIYSDEFLAHLSEYIGGDHNLEMEANTKVDWSRGLLAAVTPYLDLPGASFLDAGCGHGVLSLAAHLEGMEVQAFDFVQKAVDLANTRFLEAKAPITAFHHDVRAEAPTDFAGRFDLVASNQVLEHIPRKDQFTAIRRLCGMVKPGGFLFIDTENSLYPHDRHDTGLPLVRMLAPQFQEALVAKFGKGLDMDEPSFGRRTDLHDYLSYDEIVGATQVLGLDVVNAVMPHGTARQRFLSMTGSHWLYDNIAQYFESERFMPVSALFQKRP